MGNIIAGKVARKLGLKFETHPHPYTLGLITSGAGGIRVGEQCKVPFSIVNYPDEVICDVVEGLDVCHVILGRLWQFDVNSRNEGITNVYLIRLILCIGYGVKFSSFLSLTQLLSQVCRRNNHI